VAGPLLRRAAAGAAVPAEEGQQVPEALLRAAPAGPAALRPDAAGAGRARLCGEADAAPQAWRGRDARGEGEGGEARHRERQSERQALSPEQQALAGGGGVGAKRRAAGRVGRRFSTRRGRPAEAATRQAPQQDRDAEHDRRGPRGPLPGPLGELCQFMRRRWQQPGELDGGL